MIYHVWIVSAFDTFIPQLIGDIVNHGWGVHPLASDNRISHYPQNSEFGVLTGLRLEKNVKRTITEVTDEVREILHRLEITYIAIIVYETPIAGASWATGAFPTLPKQDEKIIH